jgi:hypothetical protein
LGFQSNHIYGSERLLPLIFLTGVVSRHAIHFADGSQENHFGRAKQRAIISE